jgi:dATP pyrophosphohydrolase
VTRRPEEVLVFVRRGEQFLVLLRSERQGGYWHSVAGGLEDGETYAQAAARELLEETGLAAAPVDLRRRLVYTAEAWEAHFDPAVAEIAVECFVVEAPAGWEPELDWEHDEYRWCSREEAVGLLYWPEPREVLEKIV